jgi:hypothetical protein
VVPQLAGEHPDRQRQIAAQPGELGYRSIAGAHSGPGRQPGEQAFLDLPLHCQRLIALLTADPPVPYAEISARLGIPVGSIGPMRRRCLDKLRRHPAIAVLITAEAGTGRPSNPVAKTLPFCG